MSASDAIWKYRSNTTINDPSRGNVRFNNVDPSLATAMAIAHVSDNGVDVSAIVANIITGDFLDIVTLDLATSYRFSVTAPAIGHGSWSDIAIGFASSLGPDVINAAPVNISVDGTAIPIPPPIVHVTLTTAKAHLRITTPDGDPGDADIQQKLDAADAIILDYLKGANGQAIYWTDPASTPPPVSSAILLMLTRLYEQRGDNEQPDADLWAAIDRLLIRFRDPALA